MWQFLCSKISQIFRGAREEVNNFHESNAGNQETLKFFQREYWEDGRDSDVQVNLEAAFFPSGRNKPN